MTLPKLLAGAVASLIMSLIWWLASPKEAQSPPVADLAALSAPITLTLAGGQEVSGEVRGVDLLCADWFSALQAAPQTVVALPDGRRVTGADVRALALGQTALAGAGGMAEVGACSSTLTVHAAGSGSPAAGLEDLKAAAESPGTLKGALDSLTGP